MTTTPFPTATILGYPRIGPDRELKKALEAFWRGAIPAADAEQAAQDLRRANRARLASLGLGRDDSAIPEASSYYDHVLDTAVAVGAVPARFADVVGPDGAVDLAGYSTIARGRGEDAPLEMTKWFDSNYHYLVPEIGPDTVFRAADRRRAAEVREAVADGFVTRPVLVGPVTFLLLAKPTDDAPEDFRPLDRLADLLPVYAELLAELRAAGAEWVQLDEPALVTDTHTVGREAVLAAVTSAYDALVAAPGRPALLVAAPYGDLRDALAPLVATGIEAVGIDLVRGAQPEDPSVLAGTTVVAGVVDGHNIWRGDLSAALSAASELGAHAAAVSVSPSTSLLHVPHDVSREEHLDPELRSWLAFADQKVSQVVTLARGLTEGQDAVRAELDEAAESLARRASTTGVRIPSIRERVAALTADDAERGDVDDRRTAQQEALGLGLLPTTTIGSFPQTGDIRRSRAAHARGDLSDADYEDAMRAEIARVVALQEDLGLDVVVHGEPERNDMVQYFAENLDGFAVTQHGWVQSYGSRATRPSILWGDVSRPAPITVSWSSYAASLTPKPVKGMLTGPVTILAWSFVRDDQPLGDTALQVALALRDEIADLEAAGIGIVQVDEPALRELLPLRSEDQPAYLDWSVRSFRVATSGVDRATQIHTHLCYSEFAEVIDAIDGLGADVTSIEAARSRMEVVDDVAASGFSRGVGPGVYDIHSPRVPSVAEITGLIETALDGVSTDLLWINPDCGLKTRGYDETVAALRNMVEAANTVRERVRVRA
ncbi:5-methyltetrahydropteroyltriglutamate--homocysteine S-methyltransferase [Curtobacterium sp. Leaf261]|uniref:5-methyltetrahydropteroyltriglutamate-- homocysteine S-methyltransferase n=1 Tax=Curtobacterium sp. Leaf261 TaxID=1736311 RepID=UPI0006F41335|nr:5-methyltetrahydropteroyltriglutamate--homocysteine S-methyltransferase [Curtobacterium sp. Leaf261]KQO62892.1 5-methyltetrahydropteroyltriglutamate--homocysteine methyltransferase [Curtobacterium sp. Leaf261]